MRIIILLQKLLPGVMIEGYRAKLIHTVYIDPGRIDLVGQEACPGTAGIEMVVIMPFTGLNSVPE